MFVDASPVLRPRVALVIPRHGHNIVDRNRLKRRLREAARLELLPRCWDGEARFDILIQARPEAYDADFTELTNEIKQLAIEICWHGSS